MEESGVRRPLLADHGQRQQQQQTRRRDRWRALAFITVASATLVALALAVGLVHGRSRASVASAGTTAADAELLARHLATKTAYWNQRRDVSSLHAPLQSPLGVAAAAETATQHSARQRSLRLVQTQLVTRHGIRYPTLGPIKDTEALLQKLQPFETVLPPWLRGYTLPYNQSVEGQLAATGVSEMERLAARQLADHGRHATGATYARDTFHLSHTHVARTKHSAVAFARQYFANPDDVELIERPKHNDTLLRFFDACARYQLEVKQNASTLAQRHAFTRSDAMAAALTQLAGNLHVDVTAPPLTVNDVSAAFSACAFDLALYGIRDHWCSLLTPAMVATLDYDDDLKAFYELAGGFAINYEMAAVLLQAIVSTMDQRIAGASKVEGVFYFAHAETTLPLLTLLGFGSKAPLTAAASREEIHMRGFRTSELSPFAANVEFRLYAQSSRGRDSRNATADEAIYYVQVLVNERDDVEIPGCNDVFCPLVQLQTTLWRRFLYEYDFAQQCQVEL